MYSVELSIGHNVNGIPYLTTENIVECVSKCIPCEGATFRTQRGIWHGEVEDSTLVIIMTDNPDFIKSYVPSVRIALNQDAIMCEVREANVEFI